MRNRWIPTCLILATTAWTLAATAAPDAPRPTLQLVAMEVRGSDNGSMSGSLLVRELQRQAIVIAAWDELGLNIRDTALGDPVLKDSDTQQTLLVETQFNRAAQAQAIVAIPGIAPADDWDHLPDVNMAKFMKANPGMIAAHTHIKLGKNPWMDYAKIADDAEQLSRKEFPPALRVLPTLTSKGEAPTQWKTEGDPAPDATALLPLMDPFSQFAAVRLLHQQIRNDGASPARLESLVRAYANLSFLTNTLYSGAYKTYMARSLLYAQRLVTLENASAHSLYVRAYARGMAGLARLALADLDAAHKNGGNEVPWSPIIEAWANYDLSAMEKLSHEPGDWQSLAAMLEYAIAVDGFSMGKQNTTALQCLQKHPENIWIMHSLFRTGGIGLSGKMPGMMLSTIPQQSASALKALHAGDAIEQLAANIPTDASPAVYAQLEKLRTTLVDSSAADTGNPSLAAFASILADEHFDAIRLRMTYIKDYIGLGPQPTSEFGTVSKPGWEHHPLAGLMEALTLPEGAQHSEFIAAMNKVKPRDAGMWLLPDYMFKLNWNDYTAKWNLWLQAEAHLDLIPMENNFDTINRGRANHDQFIRALREESPHAASPFTDWLLMYSDETRLEDPDVVARAIAEAQEKFNDRSDVLTQVAFWARDIHDFHAAAKLLEESYQLDPDYDTAYHIATTYACLGDFDKATAAVAAACRLPSHGLDRSVISGHMAQLLMYEGKYTQALPYARIAGDSYSSGGLRILADCLDHLGQLDETEELLKANAERYRLSRINWYAWAKRHQRPDVDEARKAELQHIADDPGTDEADLALVEGDRKHALELMRAGLGSASSLRQMEFALFAMESGDAKSAIEIFRSHAAQKVGGYYQALATILLAIANGDDLAAPLQRAELLNAPRTGDADETAPALIGRALAITGHKPEALRYLAIALHFPWSTRMYYGFCWDAVVKLGEDPAKLRDATPEHHLDPAQLAGAWNVTLADAHHEWTFAPDGSVDSSKGFHGHWWEANNHLYIRWTPTKWSALPLPLSPKDWTGNCDAGPNKLSLSKS